MYRHTRELQYNAQPSQPDPVFARRMQELLGGQWGVMTTMMSYLFQGWNCRGPAKYRDLLLDTATEEIGHCEMIATMIARLLDDTPVEGQAEAERFPLIGAVMSGMNPQHAIVAGLGALPIDSAGQPWSARFTTSSGNLLADMRYNVTAESQSRLQTARLFNMTDDVGVRDMFAFLLARDTMHQNQWLAAIEDLEAEGLEQVTCPSNFPAELQIESAAYQYLNFSDGEDGADGSWASGQAPDGVGTIRYVAEPSAIDGLPRLGKGNPLLYSTPPFRIPPAANVGQHGLDDLYPDPDPHVDLDDDEGDDPSTFEDGTTDRSSG